MESAETVRSVTSAGLSIPLLKSQRKLLELEHRVDLLFLLTVLKGVSQSIELGKWVIHAVQVLDAFEHAGYDLLRLVLVSLPNLAFAIFMNRHVY